MVTLRIVPTEVRVRTRLGLCDYSVITALSRLLGSTAVDSSPVKPAPSSDWLTESSDPEATLVNSASESEADSLEPAPTFFRSFIFSPEVPIRLDYQGKRVDMEQVG